MGVTQSHASVRLDLPRKTKKEDTVAKTLVQISNATDTSDIQSSTFG